MTLGVNIAHIGQHISHGFLEHADIVLLFILIFRTAIKKQQIAVLARTVSIESFLRVVLRNNFRNTLFLLRFVNKVTEIFFQIVVVELTSVLSYLNFVRCLAFLKRLLQLTICLSAVTSIFGHDEQGWQFFEMEFGHYIRLRIFHSDESYLLFEPLVVGEHSV
jgi:hypothetical protein